MWGGEGLLGCGVGFGLLHRIPQVRPELEVHVDDEASAYAQYNNSRDELLDQNNGALFVPADDIYDDGEDDSSLPAAPDNHVLRQYPPEDSEPNGATPPAPLPADLGPPQSRPPITSDVAPPRRLPQSEESHASDSDASSIEVPHRVPSLLPPNRSMTPTGTPIRGLAPTWRNHGRVASGMDFNLKTPRAASASRVEEDDDGDDEDGEDGTGVSGSITSVD